MFHENFMQNFSVVREGAERGKGKCFPSPIIPRMSINEMQILKLISSLERENDDQNTFRSLHEVSDVGFSDPVGGWWMEGDCNCC
jgi:hypothetical protein